MARARNIKPAFFANEYLAELSFEARLLFVGLWTLADRRGRLEDRPKGIKGKLFPYDNLDIDALLRELTDSPEVFIIRYEVDGKRYIQVVNFEKHQNPHVKEAESTIPAPCLYSVDTVQEQDEHQLSPADSLLLIPDTLNLIPDIPCPSSTEMPGAKNTPEILSGFSDAVRDAVTSWIAYKTEKNQKYKPEGLKKLVSQIRNAVAKHGDEAVVDIIEQSMAANYAGIVFDKLKRLTPNSGTLPTEGRYKYLD